MEDGITASTREHLYVVYLLAELEKIKQKYKRTVSDAFYEWL